MSPAFLKLLPLIIALLSSAARVAHEHGEANSDRADMPISVDSDDSIVDLRPAECQRMSFDEGAKALAPTPYVIQDIRVYLEALNARIQTCPDCQNLVAASLNLGGTEHAWARVSLVVNVIDSVANTSWLGDASGSEAISIRQKMGSALKRLVEKAWTVLSAYVANDHYFNKAACENKVLSLKCLLSVAVAVTNKVAQDYFHSLLAVISSILSDAVLAAQDVWQNGLSSAALWKIMFSIVRLTVFTIVALSHGKAVGQFADALVVIGRKQVSAQLAEGMLLLGSSRTVLADIMQDLRSQFRGSALDDIEQAVMDRELGRYCADKVASIGFANPVGIAKEDLVEDIASADDLVPGSMWGQEIQAHPGKVFNSFLWQQRPALAEEPGIFNFFGWQHPSDEATRNPFVYYWQDLLQRYQQLASATQGSPADATRSCELAKQVCTNKKPPRERPIDFAFDGFSQSADWVIEPIDEAMQVALALPLGYSCCLTSKTCSFTD